MNKITLYDAIKIANASGIIKIFFVHGDYCFNLFSGEGIEAQGNSQLFDYLMTECDNVVLHNGELFVFIDVDWEIDKEIAEKLTNVYVKW